MCSSAKMEDLLPHTTADMMALVHASASARRRSVRRSLLAPDGAGHHRLRRGPAGDALLTQRSTAGAGAGAGALVLMVLLHVLFLSPLYMISSPDFISFSASFWLLNVGMECLHAGINDLENARKKLE
jgi:hypothetical protein